MPNFSTLKAPATGTAITRKNGRLVVPDDPIIPYIEGDGTGPDIWRASVRVFDAAVAKAYGGSRKIAWMEVYAGEKSAKQFDNWLPDDTIEAFREYYVGIKGPLTTPVGGGIRSLNVALRQLLDLYVCLRPVRWYRGVPSPVKRPEKVDMVIFRENTEDIYAGIEYAAGSPEAQKLLDFFAREFPKEFKKIRFGTAEAAADLEKVLEIQPSDAEAHTALGNALLQKGSLQEAIAHYEKASALAPEDPHSRSNLAWLLATSSDASIRDGAKAVELAQQAVSVSGGKEPLFFRTLAAAYAETGHFSDAIAVIQQAEAIARMQGKTAVATLLEEDGLLYRGQLPLRRIFRGD